MIEDHLLQANEISDRVKVARIVQKLVEIRLETSGQALARLGRMGKRTCIMVILARHQASDDQRPSILTTAPRHLFFAGRGGVGKASQRVQALSYSRTKAGAGSSNPCRRKRSSSILFAPRRFRFSRASQHSAHHDNPYHYRNRNSPPVLLARQLFGFRPAAPDLLDRAPSYSSKPCQC